MRLNVLTITCSVFQNILEAAMQRRRFYEVFDKPIGGYVDQQYPFRSPIRRKLAG